jgi:hypothetical protein
LTQCGLSQHEGVVGTTGVGGDVASTHECVGNQLGVVEGLGEVKRLASPHLRFGIAPLVLVQPATKLCVSIAKAKEVGPYRGPRVGEEQLDDLEMLLDDADEVVGPDKPVSLDVLDQDGVKVGDQLGAGGATQGSTRAWRRRKAQVSFGDIKGLGEQTLIQGARLVTAVLPAGQGDPKRGIGRQLVVIEAGLLTQGS